MPKPAHLVAFCLIFTSACAHHAIRNITDASQLSLEDQAGQTLMFGLNDRNFAEIKTAAQTGQLGSVIVYSSAFQDAADLKRKLFEIQSAARIPVLFAADVEGGRVDRLSRAMSTPHRPGAKEQGEKGDLFTYQTASDIAHDLKSLGIQMNMAPVADVNVDPLSPIIGALERSFSSDPEVVVARIRAFARAHDEEHIAVTLKHFPGHGSAHEDSHRGWTDISTTWSDAELIPFRESLRLGPRVAVMSGHLFSSHLDSKLPASLSHAILTGLLREKLGYQGLIISDDLQMGAITANFDLRRTVTLALTAGSDILLFAQQYRHDDISQIHSMIVAKVKSVEIAPELLREAAQRVLNLKRAVDLTH